MLTHSEKQVLETLGNFHQHWNCSSIRLELDIRPLFCTRHTRMQFFICEMKIHGTFYELCFEQHLLRINKSEDGRKWPTKQYSVHRLRGKYYLIAGQLLHRIVVKTVDQPLMNWVKSKEWTLVSALLPIKRHQSQVLVSTLRYKLLVPVSGWKQLPHYELGIWIVSASTCEYFMQLRMQQLEMIALDLTFAFTSLSSLPIRMAINLPSCHNLK